MGLLSVDAEWTIESQRKNFHENKGFQFIRKPVVYYDDETEHIWHNDIWRV